MGYLPFYHQIMGIEIKKKHFRNIRVEIPRNGQTQFP